MNQKCVWVASINIILKNEKNTPFNGTVEPGLHLFKNQERFSVCFPKNWGEKVDYVIDIQSLS